MESLNSLAARIDRDVHDEYLDAIRYQIAGLRAHTVIVDECYSPALTELIETPKEKEMNELMLALEAMIKRVVQEQLAAQPVQNPSMTPEDFNLRMAFWLNNSRPTLDTIVKEAVLDKPWFDDVIECSVAEKVEAIPLPTAIFDLTNAETASKVRNFVTGDSYITDHISDTVYDRVRDMDFTVRVS